MHALMCPSALSGAKIHAIKSREVNVKIHGLHAERKILYYLRSQKNDEGFFLDPLRLGGIRRPCFICAALCFENMSQVRPGPCWVSEAGSKPKDIKEMFLILDAIRNNDNITYITDTNGHLTMDHDTESSEGSECDQDTDLKNIYLINARKSFWQRYHNTLENRVIARFSQTVGKALRGFSARVSANAEVGTANALPSRPDCAQSRFAGMILVFRQADRTKIVRYRLKFRLKNGIEYSILPKAGKWLEQNGRSVGFADPVSLDIHPDI